VVNSKPMLRSVAGWLKTALELPAVRGLDPDSPELLRVHHELLEQKPFLRSLYRDHYRQLAGFLDGIPRGPIVEIGSGGGFLKEILPAAITTDLHPGPGLDRVMTADRLEFPEASVAAILMLNVFHHLPEPRAFLREAERTLKPGGRAVLIEPAHTWLWKRLFRWFSDEPYDEGSRDWGFRPAGRFTGASVPQAWIVFERDADRFTREFPRLRLRLLRRHTAFLYLLSGGIWYRGLVPSWSYPLFAGLERLAAPALPLTASQTTYVLEKA